jgi:hypothetical protein
MKMVLEGTHGSCSFAGVGVVLSAELGEVTVAIEDFFVGVLLDFAACLNLR